MSKGVPLLGTLQRALKRPIPRPGTYVPQIPFFEQKEGGMGEGEEGEKKIGGGFKVTVLKKGEPDYERLSVLGRQLIQNVETALDEIHHELQRMAGRVVNSDYSLDNIKNYAEFYTLDPEVLKLRLKRKREDSEEEEEEEDDSSDYD